MPRVHDGTQNAIAFLYRTVEEAQARARLGGTGFWVGRELAGSKEVMGRPHYANYLVSNSHVVLEGGACVASINRKDGARPDIWETDQNFWVPHPEGDDVAVAPVWGFLKKSLHRATFIKEEQLLTKAMIAALAVGVGDEVFMIGRFINLQGTKENLPAFRFGNISAMASMIGTSGPGGVFRQQESYAVEMRSRTGFSGSPVMVYRTPSTTLADVPRGAETFWGLLGVNWGFIRDEEGENTWLNGVIPACKILDVFNTPAMKYYHEQMEMMFLANSANVAQQSIASSED